MSRKSITSITSSAGEPSFFYLIMAETAFRRADATRHPKARGTLQGIGRSYLAKATDVASTLESGTRKIAA